MDAPRRGPGTARAIGAVTRARWALTDLASTEALQGRSETAIAYAERALSLAEELGLPRPARALGSRGWARSSLGDAGGLEDFREAIGLATEAGQGRLVATLQNNLGVQVWGFDGPAASLAVLRDGIAYARARGLTESLDSLMQSAIDALVDIGEHEEVLAIAADLGPRLEANGNVFDLAGIRAVQVKVFALRGEGLEVEEMLGWLEPAARGTGDTSLVVSGLGAAALVRAGIGQPKAALALLTELDAYPGARENPNYADLLPALVRASLASGDAVLAERLARGLQPRNAYAEHALVAVNAALTEARGDLQAAADSYLDAADRWERFGVVPEQAFALLGRGRCLLGLAQPTEATPVLRHAREIFVRLGAAAALAEADSLLERSPGVTTTP